MAEFIGQVSFERAEFRSRAADSELRAEAVPLAARARNVTI
jgi:hypothetical protein